MYPAEPTIAALTDSEGASEILGELAEAEVLAALDEVSLRELEVMGEKLSRRRDGLRVSLGAHSFSPASRLRFASLTSASGTKAVDALRRLAA
jgi:hypothetical protein